MSYYADFWGEEGFGTYEVIWGERPEFRRVSRMPELTLIPGFVDIHCHGGWGIDFMSASANELRTLCEKFAMEGYEGFLPTTVTASVGDVLHAVRQLPDDPMILGFHLEGPFISHRFPGAQPPGEIQEVPMTASAWDEVFDHPKLRIVTLAPEIPFALELTARLTSRDVIVSMGHSSATFDEARRGFEFGAHHTTHTFNAMRPLHHREVGIIGYALLSEGLTCELIYDRLHVSREAARLLLKAKGRDNVIAVSDSSAATRLTQGTKLDMWGQPCTVGRGDVRLDESDRLAGSATSLYDGFKNLWEDIGPEEAISLCCFNPRRALGVPTSPQVWIELDKNLEIVGRRGPTGTLLD